MKNLPIIGGVIFLIFSIFSYLVSQDIFDQVDFDLTVKIQDRLGNSMVEIFSPFSLFGSAEIAFIILLIILIFSKKLKSIFVLLFFILTGVIELFSKLAIDHQGPPILFLKTHLSVSFPSSYIPHIFFSYPSGHSARTVFVSLILFFVIWFSQKLSIQKKQILTIFIIIFDLCMLISRVYLGEHWTTDVIGGVLLGSSLAFMASFFVVHKKKEV